MQWNFGSEPTASAVPCGLPCRVQQGLYTCFFFLWVNNQLQPGAPARIFSNRSLSPEISSAPPRLWNNTCFILIWPFKWAFPLNANHLSRFKPLSHACISVLAGEDHVRYDSYGVWYVTYLTCLRNSFNHTWGLLEPYGPGTPSTHRQDALMSLLTAATNPTSVKQKIAFTQSDFYFFSKDLGNFTF